MLNEKIIIRNEDEDMMKFLGAVDARDEVIDEASSEPLPVAFATNIKAAALHPKKQYLEVGEIIEHNADTKTYILKTADGAPAAYFRAGQYLSVKLTVGGNRVTRAYSICSSPKAAFKGEYAITVKRVEDGFVSGYILDNWKEGAKVEVSDPSGTFWYETLRDAKTVIGAAGGSGITPFLSFARAIADGTEDFNLTILYGSRTSEDMLFVDEFKKIKEKTDKVKLVNVFSEEKSGAAESGFITADLIKKYAGEDEYSVFICGPQAMYKFLDKETAKLGIKQKYIRCELFGAEKCPQELADFPKEAVGKEYNIKVNQCGTVKTISAPATETILVSLEKAGIAAPSKCRSGECGYCHSKLISGTVYIPKDTDGRRAGDLQFGYIHPCSTFPTSDIEMELPSVY